MHYSLHTDLAVGRITKENIPPDYLKVGIKLFLERFRRGLNLHEEFSERLSDFDRSALWKRNSLVAVGLTFCKVYIKDREILWILFTRKITLIIV